MERNLDSEAAIIGNDLSSMVHRVEMLQANPHYTNALMLIQKACLEIGEGRTEIHQAEMNKRFAEQDCLGHVASEHDPKICGRCGVHIDSLRPATPPPVNHRDTAPEQ